ncbi:CYTH domain-containing protein [Ilumatobacter nonamiensis]|uniref:CYTH domain-containing protein n=1 Tax=Ilumatobacter nonamiensis TaxID=467093 RepID=UPI000349A2CF|nr:CYTH domain-containing protein [Ilumatobacter nonamiensis]
MSGHDIEIERRFAVNELPGELGPSTSIEQHYVALDGDRAVRVRREDGRCHLTVKGGRGLERTEIELTIEPTQFDRLAALGDGRTIRKQRHRIELPGGLVAELDRFGGDLEGLTLVEVEFESRSSAEAFVPPPWFGDELTDRRGWSNADLAVHGLPIS